LARETNALLDSNREIVERARTHVGNLAHALKTPLSVIANEADTERTPLAAKVLEQTRVMRDQVNHYLDRARAAARSNVVGSTTETAPVVEALVRTFQKIHRDGDLAFDVRLQATPRFRGEKQDLEEMLGNLLDNAGKWARSRIIVTLALDPAEDSGGQDFLLFRIDDDGPGLSEEQMEQAVKRGRRLDETKPGSGLGLSIVADLAAVYAGSFQLNRSPEGGLRATLRLPAA
jgi:signal transduction histidine kinase